MKPGEDRPEPTKEMIEAKFWEVYPRCSAKVLQEVKTGMIVVFHDLGEYPAGGYQELVDNPEEFLAKTYGKKKIKVNFYDGENFVCTINFKVAGWTEHRITSYNVCYTKLLRAFHGYRIRLPERGCRSRDHTA